MRTTTTLFTAVLLTVFSGLCASASNVTPHHALRDPFALWTVDPAQAPAQRPDLAAIRPVIDRLDHEIVESLAATAPLQTSQGCVGELRGAKAIATAKHRLRHFQRVGLGRSLRHFCAIGQLRWLPDKSII
ncbi:hypothetical protein LFM09_10275 [Lentzea alba]|uniref:hypothetical protein n=1 Tax=Lentzea alba TaxID=2714351 RepID=UPI0039BFC092